MTLHSGAKRLSNGTEKNKQEYKVKVVCRVRPFLPHEEPDESVTVEGNSVAIVNQRNKSENLKYSFDSCYGPDAKQRSIFEKDVKPLIQNIFKGLNTTIFCYGVTGAGKTHTIQGSDKEPGIIPRTLQRVFKEKKKRPELDIKISYMEIYKENVYDLLVPRESNVGLAIREDSNRNIFVANLSEKTITSYEQFEKIYAIACKGRSTASTKLNMASSRSHAILSLQVQWRDEEKKKTITGKTHLIDLAGSEDNRRTGNGKDRMAESAAINKSLFVLGQVVEALNAGATRIPYRDSKMTRILQDSLGGRSLAMMIVNVAPGQKFYLDTHNTLNFATKSKEIVNKAVVNEVADQPKFVKPMAPASLGKAQRIPSAPVVPAASIASTTVNGPKKRLRLSDTTSDAVTTKKISKGERLSDGVIETMEVTTKNKKITDGDLEARVQKILDKKMKEMSGVNPLASTLVNLKSNTKQGKSEAMEIADLLTPCTKTKNAKAYIVRGKLLQQQGQLESALGYFEKAAVFVPNNDKLHKRISGIQAILNDPDYSRSATVTNPPRRIFESSKLRNSSNSDDEYVEDEEDEEYADGERELTTVEKEILSIVNSGKLRLVKTLKGVGEKRARQIVDFIESNGPINSPNELTRAGLSENIVANIVKGNSN
ncbi:kinesin-domain-containing protein [Basidiobolus meristosporus CBS 931.73]|uniref:Kinesin-domain-containing protein n=1 Tax=Basidiobolus meristosporus CBS 931.73 TaxID=1314790 RepID=A0A1Y1YJP3_9FUNG|nr:kinesin-domain-containing protein [Basidiobolus meristosporus CBS 931.73]|eukprot:ORX97824.1 kinesin-domain-containing protein [Basidiobolus meristosporus CBS 931.73]